MDIQRTRSDIKTDTVQETLLPHLKSGLLNFRFWKTNVQKLAARENFVWYVCLTAHQFLMGCSMPKFVFVFFNAWL